MHMERQLWRGLYNARLGFKGLVLTAFEPHHGYKGAAMEGR